MRPLALDHSGQSILIMCARARSAQACDREPRGANQSPLPLSPECQSQCQSERRAAEGGKRGNSSPPVRIPAGVIVQQKTRAGLSNAV